MLHFQLTPEMSLDPHVARESESNMVKPDAVKPASLKEIERREAWLAVGWVAILSLMLGTAMGFNHFIAHP